MIGFSPALSSPLVPLRKAMLLLKKKRYQEQLLDKTENQISNLERMVSGSGGLRLRVLGTSLFPGAGGPSDGVESHLNCPDGGLVLGPRGRCP